MKTELKKNIYFSYHKQLEYFVTVSGVFARNLDGQLCREVYGEEFILKMQRKHRELYEMLNALSFGGLEILEFLLDYPEEEFDMYEYRNYIEKQSNIDFLYKLFGYRAEKTEIEEALGSDEKLVELMDSGKFWINSFVVLKRMIDRRAEFLDLFYAAMEDLRTPELESYLKQFEKVLPMLQHEIEYKLEQMNVTELTSEIACKCLPSDWVHEDYTFEPLCMLPRNAATYYKKRQLTIYSQNRVTNRQKAMQIMKVLSDENRIRIIDLLSESGTANGKKIVKWMHLAPSTISHHMEQLIECSIVKEERNGTSKEYSIDYKVGEMLIRELDGIIMKNKDHVI